MDFGAIANGKSDDSKAFTVAWKKACDWNGKSKVFVPPGKYLISSVVFEGPCKGPIYFAVKGFVKAPADLSTLLIRKYGLAFDTSTTLPSLEVEFSMAKDKPHGNKMTATKTPKIKSINSKKVHINVFACYNLNLKSIEISAPGDNPNTDGIHIGSSTEIKIYDSLIGTGDDCVLLSPESENILVSNVLCGPGHGTDNGVRIKTWPDSYEGVLSNFTFEDIVMNNVQNPIVIGQEYYPYNACNKKVKTSNVKYNNILRTSSAKVAVNLLCSRLNPCKNVEIGDINLVFNGTEAGPTTSSCLNVEPILKGRHIPITCV
ncbi:polygalacturonase-like [Mangifera indica]|uniref:polygalacturonase-like n=1 Tax=Mangifera indica TaxID=29780 RepID=UPI001CFB0EA3|nr:polygalacturonase-like [Mangifera indica]